MTPKEKKAVVECVVSLADIHARLEDEEVVKESAAVLKKILCEKDGFQSIRMFHNAVCFNCDYILRHRW